MKLFHRVAVLAMALGLAIAVTPGFARSKQAVRSSSKAARARHRLVIGFVEIGSESDWRKAHTKDVKKEAARRGIELKFSDAQQKQENEIKAVKSFIVQKVDAIILAPVVQSGWDPVLREAKRHHIPVILSDRGVKVSDPSLYATLVGPDFVEEGRMAAEWLARQTGGNCNVVELQGTIGSAPAVDRKNGFMDAIAKYPGIKVIASQCGDFRRDGGRAVMEALIEREGKNIQAVYAHNDEMAIGAIEALDRAGMEPGKSVIVVSIDAVRAAFDEMVAGKLNASVECTPLLGAGLLDACEKAIKGEKLPEFIPSKERVFDQSNAKEYISTRTY